MARWRDFDPLDPLPSNWTDAMEELLSSYAGANFRVEKFSNTTLRVVAGPGDDQVGIAVDGRPRWIIASVTAAHPGGAAGEYDIYVTSHVDTFGVDGGGHEIITSNMNFGLRVGAPTGVGEEALSRKVATCTWDGTKITAVRQIVGGVPVSERPWEVGDCKPSLQPTDHPGWSKMDGRQTLVRSSYPAQFVTMMTGLGYTGNGVTTFGVPDMRGRTWVGEDSAGIRIANAAKRDLTETGGVERVTLAAAESGVATHGHGNNFAIGASEQIYQNIDTSYDVPNWPNTPMWRGAGPQFEVRIQHSHPLTGGVTNHAGAAAVNSHDNMPPYFVGNWFVFTGEGAAATSGGGGGGSGSLGSRRDVPVITAALAAAASVGAVGGGESGAAALGAGFRALRVIATSPCRVRLYTTPAQRTADVARSLTLDPPDYPAPGATPNHGCQLEVIFGAAHLVGGVYVQDIAPNQVLGSNELPVSGDIAYRIDNMDVAAHAITVTFTVQGME